MGMWDNKPYGNDIAVNLFSDLMYYTKMRDHWYQVMTLEGMDYHPNELRAMVWLFIQLGHVNVWPEDHYNSDLELAIYKADHLRNNSDLIENKGMKELLDKEYLVLLDRQKEEVEMKI